MLRLWIIPTPCSVYQFLPLIVLQGKGGMKVETSTVAVKTVTIKCPECLNSMKVKAAEKGNYSGKCPVCQSLVFSKQHSAKERHIKIVRNTAN